MWEQPAMRGRLEFQDGVQAIRFHRDEQKIVCTGVETRQRARHLLGRREMDETVFTVLGGAGISALVLGGLPLSVMGNLVDQHDLGQVGCDARSLLFLPCENTMDLRLHIERRFLYRNLSTCGGWRDRERQLVDS